MQKRSEVGKQEKVFFRTKLKHTAIVVLCMMFALSTIYAVDISTYKLANNNTDQYAMRITNPGDNKLRIDVAGKRYDFDIQNLKSYTGKLTQKTKMLIKGIQSKLH
ncbi:MAG: hypothetical protein K0Q99_35 [Clostridia bacterium]|jgi:hypothetical protein|nr:hypothetical protein [Clostridia bacterium]